MIFDDDFKNIIIYLLFIMKNFYEELDTIFNEDSLIELKIKVIEAYERNISIKSNYIAKYTTPINFKITNGEISVV